MLWKGCCSSHPSTPRGDIVHVLRLVPCDIYCSCRGWHRCGCEVGRRTDCKHAGRAGAGGGHCGAGSGANLSPAGDFQGVPIVGGLLDRVAASSNTCFARDLYRRLLHIHVVTRRRILSHFLLCSQLHSTRPQVLPVVFKGQGELIVEEAQSMADDSVGTAHLGFMADVRDELEVCALAAYHLGWR